MVKDFLRYLINQLKEEKENQISLAVIAESEIVKAKYCGKAEGITIAIELIEKHI